MRHCLSTNLSCGASEGPVAVGLVEGLVVGDALGQAVPQDLRPAVANCPRRGRMGLYGFDRVVVELPARRLWERLQGPLVDGGPDVVVVRHPAGNDEVALARAAGDRGLSGVALQRVRRDALLDVVADFARDPGGGETVIEAGKAQVDLTARGTPSPGRGPSRCVPGRCAARRAAPLHAGSAA